MILLRVLFYINTLLADTSFREGSGQIAIDHFQKEMRKLYEISPKDICLSTWQITNWPKKVAEAYKIFFIQRAFVRRKQLKTPEEYRQFVKENPHYKLPRFPDGAYGDHWRGWDDFLGIEGAAAPDSTKDDNTGDSA